jgi:hypothetical protein
MTMIALRFYFDLKIFKDLFKSKEEYADQLYNDFMSYLSSEKRK